MGHQTTPPLQNAPAFSPSEMLDPAAAAALIGGSERPLSVDVLANWRTKGIGPAYIKAGRLVRYRRADVEAWLMSRIHGGGHE